MERTPVDYALTLPVSRSAQLVWLWTLDRLYRSESVPTPQQVAAKFGITERRAYVLVHELMDAGELLGDRPGATELAVEAA